MTDVLVLLFLHLLDVHGMVMVILRMMGMMRLLRCTRATIFITGRYRAPLQRKRRKLRFSRSVYPRLRNDIINRLGMKNRNFSDKNFNVFKRIEHTQRVIRYNK